MDTQHLLMPYDMYKLIEPHIIRLDYDYDYVNGSRAWKLHKDNRVSFEALHKDALTALQVAQKLES